MLDGTIYGSSQDKHGADVHGPERSLHLVRFDAGSQASRVEQYAHSHKDSDDYDLHDQGDLHQDSAELEVFVFGFRVCEK